MVFKELQQAILDVLPSKDPLDDPDFDAINYMNNLFPNETSLDIIENEVKKLRRKVRRIDEEIIELVNAQIHAGSRGGIQLDNAKASIQVT
ncbi:vacuolar protein sorting-associated protein 53 homolog isoform X4 [Schistocerca gregaria]|uniref:vacuolar protein sorting-associated protein 53 homolog isoform X4 n=1 Tax=Schistocerca gregaria TaxID=7010 RepID=UPI00211E537D|nr:vacuolar protein sorting-associated protein 53 homolog isoform X4 [Schistocerca gregaria]